MYRFPNDKYDNIQTHKNEHFKISTLKAVNNPQTRKKKLHFKYVNLTVQPLKSQVVASTADF